MALASGCLRLPVLDPPVSGGRQWGFSSWHAVCLAPSPCLDRAGWAWAPPSLWVYGLGRRSLGLNVILRPFSGASHRVYMVVTSWGLPGRLPGPR